jgi:hypothetical protein
MVLVQKIMQPLRALLVADAPPPHCGSVPGGARSPQETPPSSRLQVPL